MYYFQVIKKITFIKIGIYLYDLNLIHPINLKFYNNKNYKFLHKDIQQMHFYFIKMKILHY